MGIRSKHPLGVVNTPSNSSTTHKTVGIWKYAQNPQPFMCGASGALDDRNRSSIARQDIDGGEDVRLHLWGGLGFRV